ncbi:MAG: YbaB/EbfC family nucleoid-associated protein [candidate division WOR-3 bacterium]
MKGYLNNLKRIQQEMTEFLKTLTVEGSAGGGMVKIVMNGDQNVLEVKIEQEIIQANDPVMLQDLIRAAFNDAQQKVRSQVRDQLSKRTGIPFDLSF